MCLGLGGDQFGLIPPSPKGKNLADYIRVCIVLQVIVSLLYFISGTLWSSGLFTILFAFIGFSSIKSEGYNLQCLLCYFMVCGMDFFWGLIKLIQDFANLLPGLCNYGWQKPVCDSSIIAGPLISIVAALFSYFLYQELRRQVNEMFGADMENLAGGQGGGASMAQQSAPLRGNSFAAPGVVAPPSNTTSSFKAFSGTGYKLGA